MAAGGDFSHGQAIVLLVEEEPRLLAVFYVYVIQDAVLVDRRHGTARLRQKVGFIPSLILGHAVELPHLDVVALVNAADGYAHGGQLVDEGLEDHRLDLIHAVA